jgi:hypothetical protein
MSRSTAFRADATISFCHLMIASFLGIAAAAVVLSASASPTMAEEVAQPAIAEEKTAEAEPDPSSNEQNRPPLSDREAALIKMLSGATLEGSFTNTSADRDPTKLSQEKYTLGDVTKVNDRFWLIPARIQYGEHDVTLPITVPIEWAGDTPVIVVDNIALPRFGAVSARVMFFEDHYAGYWKHGANGGHLFGTIRREEQTDSGESQAE